MANISKSPNLLLIFAPLFVLLWLSWQASSVSCSTTSSPHDFIPCLLENSHPSHPISPAIFTPKNSTFSSVLQSYIRNLRFNTSSTRKPFLIITALHESHIQAAIVCAHKLNLQMKIRSGGHDYEGVSYVAEVPFFILDMFNLRKINIDIEKETAWVQTGATLGEVYYNIAQRSKVHGYPAGVCPTVGVGGHISGGGYGTMMRKFGLTVDNLDDALLIDINGRLLDRKAMGEDLFWAISGGGGASFGVVLAYKIKLVRVPEKATFFSVQRTMEQNASFIASKWQQVADKLDDDVFVRLVMDVKNDTKTGKRTGRATFNGFYLGGSESIVSILGKSFPELGLKQSDCNETSWIKATVLFWTSNIPNGSYDSVLISRTPSVNYLKRKSDYVKKPITKKGLESIWGRMMELDGPIMLTFNPYGGRMAEIPENASPFPHRVGNLALIQYAINWNEAGADVANKYIGLTRKLYQHMTPFVSKNPREAFFNYKDLDLGINHNGKASYWEGRAYGVKYFKGNFNRLVEIKRRVDPGNFFRNEQSIPVFPHHL
ncbi:berberine bridge enzyme-like 8 [Humulus lupulus]|uniref:berberine bridge enzyme-like 8 n=1 Tax=Humulus lupulus TaxID=3486 RepID=UPI002B409485|nr:berberine bridge enzyme-like 8 [Humulus lupulus]